MTIIPNVIGGEFIENATKTLPVTNPATNEVIGEIPLSTREDLNSAVTNARIAQRHWATVPIKDRVQVMFKLKELIEAGVHLGHQKKDWNPKMEEYIFDTKDGVHIINLSKTVNNLMKAGDFLKQQAKNGKNILFVGTSKQTSQIIKEHAERAEIFFINQRWLGGLITNFDTIRARLNKLREMELQKETGGFVGYAKKEVASVNRLILKLNKSLGGLKKMRGKPDIIVAFDVAIKKTSKLIPRKTSNPRMVNFVSMLGFSFHIILILLSLPCHRIVSCFV